MMLKYISKIAVKFKKEAYNDTLQKKQIGYFWNVYQSQLNRTNAE